MDMQEMDRPAPVEGQRIPESLGKIWAIVGGSVLVTLLGAVPAWAWWTEFPLWETEEVRPITPEDQWQNRQARTVNGKEIFEIPADPGHPVPVKTHHVLGFKFGVLGALVALAGLAAMLAGIGRSIHSLIQRPTLIIGESSFQLVVRDHFVKLHIPYKNVKETSLVTGEGTEKPIFIGVNLHDLSDPATHYQWAARSKKWTGWDYAIGNNEIFALPIAEIYERLQRAMKRG